MAAIAKFISFDGGIAFSDSVVKFQKRNGDAKLFPLGEIDSVGVRRPQQENRGFIRLQTRDGKLYRIFFDEEQFSQALVFKKQLDSQLSAGVPAQAEEPAQEEPVPEEPVPEQPVSEQPDSGSLPEERPERRPSKRRKETAIEYDEDTEEEQEEEEDDSEDGENPSILRKWWLWLIIVLLVIAIAAAALLIVRKLKADDAAPSAPVNTSAISIPAAIDEPEAPGADSAPADGATP